MGDDSESSNVGQLGRIALKRVAVPRKRTGDNRSEESSSSFAAPRENPANRLVPFLDLFGRLTDTELGRLATVDTSLVAEMRTQVDQIQTGLAEYIDLADRLSEAELVRLTQASQRTVRFWLLCQPRDRPKAKSPPPASDPSGGYAGVGDSGNLREPAAGDSSSQSGMSASASQSGATLRSSSRLEIPRPPADAGSSSPHMAINTEEDDFDFDLFDDEDDDLF